MKSFIAIIALFLCFSCSNDDSNFASKTDIDLVTGIYLRNSEFSETIKLGNPNVFSNDQFIAYPNPPNGFLSLSSSENISDLWIVPAYADKVFQQTDFNSLLNSDLYSENLIETHSELQLTNLNFNNILVDLENTSPGYYKVFVKINGTFYWENIYVPDNDFEIEDLINYWD